MEAHISQMGRTRREAAARFKPLLPLSDCVAKCSSGQWDYFTRDQHSELSVVSHFRKLLTGFYSAWHTRASQGQELDSIDYLQLSPNYLSKRLPKSSSELNKAFVRSGLEPFTLDSSDIVSDKSEAKRLLSSHLKVKFLSPILSCFYLSSHGFIL